MWVVQYDGYAALKQFPQMNETNPFMAIPLVDRIAAGFLGYIEQHPRQLGITDISRLEVPQFPEDTTYCLVVGGKLVIMEMNSGGVTEEIKPWWMTQSIWFGENREGSLKMFEAVKEFAGRRSLEQWVAEAAAELMKGDVRRLFPEMIRIYLRG
jgi:hypothetical protein